MTDLELPPRPRSLFLAPNGCALPSRHLSSPMDMHANTRARASMPMRRCADAPTYRHASDHAKLQISRQQCAATATRLATRRHSNAPSRQSADLYMPARQHTHPCEHAPMCTPNVPGVLMHSRRTLYSLCTRHLFFYLTLQSICCSTLGVLKNKANIVSMPTSSVNTNVSRSCMAQQRIR